MGDGDDAFAGSQAVGEATFDDASRKTPRTSTVNPTAGTTRTAISLHTSATADGDSVQAGVGVSPSDACKRKRGSDQGDGRDEAAVDEAGAGSEEEIDSDDSEALQRQRTTRQRTTRAGGIPAGTRSRPRSTEGGPANENGGAQGGRGVPIAKRLPRRNARRVLSQSNSGW